MPTPREKLVLAGAFVAAVALHIAVLPWFGSAVGRSQEDTVGDMALTRFDGPGYARGGMRICVNIELNYQPPLTKELAYEPVARADRLVLSRDRTADPDDYTMGVFDQTIPLQDISPLVHRFCATLPDDADGPYWLIYTADDTQQLPDRDRANNTRAVPTFIDGPEPPVLRIDKFDAPQRATTGGSMLVSLGVTNAGMGWANNRTTNIERSRVHWADRVYLSLDETLDENDYELRCFDRMSPLAPGDAYHHDRVELPVPRGVVGQAYLIAVADADQVLDQPSFTDAIAVRPIELVDSGQPDLIVPRIDPLQRLVINRPSPVTFSVANLGPVPTATSQWVDRLYLSKSRTLDDTAIPLTDLPAGQPLQPRSRYESTAQVTLTPDVEPGQWFLIANTDADRDIHEAGFEDNNTLAIPVTVLTQEQADAEIQLGDPDRPERMVVQWIEHDRLEEHRAQLSRTVQPALQAKADPTPNAPLNFDPLPPAVDQLASTQAGDPKRPSPKPNTTQVQESRPLPTPPDATQTDLAPRPQDPGSPTPTRIEGLPGDKGEVNPRLEGIDQPTPNTQPRPTDPTPSDQIEPSPKPGDKRITSPADPNAPNTDSTTDSQTPSEKQSDTDSTNPQDTATNKPSEQLKPVEVDQPKKEPDDNAEPSTNDGKGEDNSEKQKPRTSDPDEEKSTKPDGEEADPASPSEEKTPTSVPKDESEAPPTNNRKIDVALQPGRVLVGKGIKVTTKLPTPPGTGARSTSLPRNARVSVTFNSKGKVHEAKVTSTTKYAEWDAAIEASLYRWTAQGEAIDNAKPYITIEWNYILNELLGDDE